MTLPSVATGGPRKRSGLSWVFLFLLLGCVLLGVASLAAHMYARHDGWSVVFAVLTAWSLLNFVHECKHPVSVRGNAPGGRPHD